MLVDFDILPAESRIWVYASIQKLGTGEEEYILNYISNHLNGWVAHGAPLRSSVKILDHYFIVVALDEAFNEASGCSIDSLQNNIKEIEQELSISLMNRLNIYCIIKDVITCVPIGDLGDAIDQETLFYDLTIKSKAELSSWLKPIKEGWCNTLLD